MHPILQSLWAPLQYSHEPHAPGGYRSDCSGLASFVWGLPPPGATSVQLTRLFGAYTTTTPAVGDLIVVRQPLHVLVICKTNARNVEAAEMCSRECQGFRRLRYAWVKFRKSPRFVGVLRKHKEFTFSGWFFDRNPLHHNALRFVVATSRTTGRIFGADPDNLAWTASFTTTPSGAYVVDFQRKATHRGPLTYYATVASSSSSTFPTILWRAATGSVRVENWWLPCHAKGASPPLGVVNYAPMLALMARSLRAGGRRPTVVPLRVRFDAASPADADVVTQLIRDQIKYPVDVVPANEHITCRFRTNASIIKDYGKTFDGLSLATVNGPWPREVIINERNWRGAIPLEHWRGDLQAYRRYLVTHEFLHAFGFEHDDAPSRSTDACSVMVPQTKPHTSCVASSAIAPWIRRRLAEQLRDLSSS